MCVIGGSLGNNKMFLPSQSEPEIKEGTVELGMETAIQEGLQSLYL